MYLTAQAMPTLEEKVQAQKPEVMLSTARCNSFTFPELFHNFIGILLKMHHLLIYLELFLQAVVEGLVEDLLTKVTMIS